ncbi:MAG: MFS transporter [Halapricum sp.]
MDSRVTRRYYLHRAAMTTGLFWPVFPLLLLDRGVSFAGIGTLLAVEAAVTLLAEVPTGFVGDAVGRRNSLLLGGALMLVGELGFAFAHRFGAFAAVYVCFGLARTFQSGSGDAWLYDVLAADGREADFTRVRGRGESITHWASTLAMLASGVLYAANPAAPFLASAALAVVDLVVLAGVPPVEGTRETRVGASEVVPTLRRTLSKQSVWPFVAVAAAFFGVERAVSEFIPSVTTAVLGSAVPLPSGGGSADVAFVGVFFAGFTAVSAVASYFAGDVRARVGAPTALAAAGYLSAALMIAAAFSPPVALASFVVVKTADALVLPLVNGYVNDRIDTAGRATTLSATSMLFTVAKMPLLVGAGVLADSADAFAAVAGLGGFFAVAASVVLLVRTPAEAAASASTAE